jgi:hypothetical protein
VPFIKSSSKEATKKNFHEFRHGPTFAKTERKYGKAKAVKQMEAAVLSNKRNVMKRGGGK